MTAERQPSSPPPDDIDLFLQSLLAEHEQQENAFVGLWNQRIAEEVAVAAGTVTHADTQRIFDFVEETDSLTHSVALFMVHEDAPALAHALHERFPLVPAKFINDWYGHPSALLVAAGPPMLESDAGEVFPDEELFAESSFPTLGSYDAQETPAIHKRIRRLLDFDATGGESVTYIADDPDLQRARASAEKFPDIANALVGYGAAKYRSLMHRMLQEVDPRSHPGADDHAELSDAGVDAYRETLVDTIWNDEVKPMLLAREQEPLAYVKIQAASDLIRRGGNPQAVILATMQGEVMSFTQEYDPHVASTFPRDLIPLSYLESVLSLVQAQKDADGLQSAELLRKIVAKESGMVVPKGIAAAKLAERIDTQTSLLARHNASLHEDQSGFDALDAMLSDPDMKARRAQESVYPKTHEAIFVMGVARYKKWHTALEQTGSVPSPRHS